jgi:anti-sigma factor RsiW
MKCNEVQQLHDAYLDSELDAKTTLEIQEHMAMCRECAHLLAVEAKLDARLMNGLQQGQRTAALWEQVERQVVADAQSDARARPAIIAARPLGWLSVINSQLSPLFGPHPKAWAGLAAVWVLILAANIAMRDDSTVMAARRVSPPTPQIREMLKQQAQLLAELTEQQPAAHRPKADRPRPQGLWREDFMNA